MNMIKNLLLTAIAIALPAIAYSSTIATRAYVDSKDSQIASSILSVVDEIAISNVTKTGNIYTPWIKTQDPMDPQYSVTPESLTNSTLRYIEEEGKWVIEGIIFKNNQSDYVFDNSYYGNRDELELHFPRYMLHYYPNPDTEEEVIETNTINVIFCTRDFVRYGNVNGLALYDDLMSTISATNTHFSEAVSNVMVSIESDIPNIITDYISNVSLEYPTSQISNIVNNINDSNLVSDSISVGGAIALLFSIISLLIKDLNSSKRYDLVTIDDSSSQLKDRSMNYISRTITEPILFPDSVNGKARDFAVISLGSIITISMPTDSSIIKDAPSYGDVVVEEDELIDENGNISITSSNNIVIAITEVSENKFYIRKMKVGI